MFRRLSEQFTPAVNVLIDEVPFSGRRGDTVAAALLLAGKSVFRRSGISDEPRGPYCMMGSCYECLVRIDGIDNVQACLTEIREGMIIDTAVRQAGN